MIILDFFKDLFADAPEPPCLPSLFPEIDAVYASGQIPLTARITIGQGHGTSMLLPVPSTSTREEAYAAVQAHYEALYGPHVKITVGHLCTSPEDDELGTWAHSASVNASCDHGLSMRIATIGVVTNREGRTCG